MILHLPHDPAATERTLAANYGDTQPPENNAVTQTPSKNTKKTITIYRDTLDICFTTQTAVPHLAPTSTLVSTFQYLRRNDPTCKFFSADRKTEWANPTDLHLDDNQLRELTQFKEYPISSRVKCSTFTIYFESGKNQRPPQRKHRIQTIPHS